VLEPGGDRLGGRGAELPGFVACHGLPVVRAVYVLGRMSGERALRRDPLAACWSCRSSPDRRAGSRTARGS
jgi:hypothetical protein